MLTRDQASTIADQYVAQAKARRDTKELNRLEARAGAKPVGMTFEQFKGLVAEAEARVYRSGPFISWMMLWIGLCAATAFINVRIVAGSIIFGTIAARQVAKKLVGNYVRGNMARKG